MRTVLCRISKSKYTLRARMLNASIALLTKSHPICTLVLLLGVLCGSSAAFEGEVGLQGMWTDNLYLTASSVEDWVTIPFGQVKASWGEDFSLRYGLNGYLYNTEDELNALWQKAAVQYNTRIGGKHDLTAELSYSGILHVSDAKNLDHHQAGATVDLSLRPWPRMLVVPGIAGYWRTYPNTENLDTIEAIGSLLINRSFSTKTTLRLGGTLYYRRFVDSVSEGAGAGVSTKTAVDTAFPPTALSALADSSGFGAGGSGQGKGQSGRGRGNGWGWGSQAPEPGVTVESNLQSQSVGQFLLTARLAQSLGSRAGMFLEGTYRTNFLDSSRFSEGSIPDVDREFFDDHYGYEGPGGRVQFSLLLPLSMRILITGLMEERRYVGREALDLDGNAKSPEGEERRDERYEIAVRGEFTRDFKRRFPTGISLDLGFVHVWNESNDDWYDTEENRVFASASLPW